MARSVESSRPILVRSRSQTLPSTPSSPFFDPTFSAPLSTFSTTPSRPKTALSRASSRHASSSFTSDIALQPTKPSESRHHRPRTRGTHVLTLFPPSPPQSGVNHNRYSTYSHSGSVKTQTSTISTAFNDIENGLRRLDDARLSKQRFEATEEKADMFAKLALGAKLERALRWRMSGQDAEYKGKLGLVQMLSLNEKAPISA